MKSATLRSSQCRPTPIHPARRPIRDMAGSLIEGGAPGEWARQIVLKPNFYLNHKSQTQPITGSYIQKNNYFIASP